MGHYLAIFVPSKAGEWCVLFPDMPDCKPYDFTLGNAKYAAPSALARCVQERGPPQHEPLDLAAVQQDERWLSLNHVDLSKAVVSLVPLSAQTEAHRQYGGGARGSNGTSALTAAYGKSCKQA